MDLAFGVNEDSAEEEDEAAKGQNCGSYELQIYFHTNFIYMELRLHRIAKVNFYSICTNLHGRSNFKICCKYAHKKGRFANFRPCFVKNF